MKSVKTVIRGNPLFSVFCATQSLATCMNRHYWIIACLLVISFFGCIENNPNLTDTGEDILEEKQVYIDAIDLGHNDTIYIPIYSDIYVESRHERYYLTATLSVRNTSLTDSMFVRQIDYYDTNGNLVREYLDKILLLKPMQSIEYVIEKDDKIGGAGANFIVTWSARHDDLIPVFQGVMISTQGQQGLSFVTEGVSISRRGGGMGAKVKVGVEE